MIRFVQIYRLLQINAILMRHHFVSTVFGPKHWFFRFMGILNLKSAKTTRTNRGLTIRQTLESLGPIYVKFGQVLSTRHDLIPADILPELQKLQDKVTPFSGELAETRITEAFKQPIAAIFSAFDSTPLASASVAQVHAATLHNGDAVVVKVLRPNILKTIRKDIAVLYLVANLTEKLWSDGKRLRPIEVVKEFEQTLYDELDLQREAANASQLRRNFTAANTLYVPKIYWDYVSQNVMVMERVHGIPLSDVDAIKAAGTNMKTLAEFGVDIFFTQVFRDSFFHADMHPGNMFIDVSNPEHPRYLGVDFGIMGTLTPEDQHYLAKNLLAFFHRDYREIAVLHIDSGWVPANTRIDQFESAIRTVCEPIFEKPINEISFGQLLLRLFQTAKRFHMTVQPQLMLLQKTLLNIESLGRQLYPELDLWSTAKPFMENWIRERQSPKRLYQLAKTHWYDTAEKLLKTPELFFDTLTTIQQNAAQKPTPQTPTTVRFPWLWPIGVTLTTIGITNAILFPSARHGAWIALGIGGVVCAAALCKKWCARQESNL